jgi:cytidine deaminase
MVTAGERRIVELVVVSESDRLCAPCGRCRQQLREFAGPDPSVVRVHLCGPEGVRVTTTLGDLLPLSFGPDTLGRSGT